MENRGLKDDWAHYKVLIVAAVVDDSELSRSASAGAESFYLPCFAEWMLKHTGLIIPGIQLNKLQKVCCIISDALPVRVALGSRARFNLEFNSI